MSHDGTQFRGATSTALEAVGRRRNVVATLPSFLVLMNLVRGSDSVAIVCRRLIDGADGLILRAPPIAVPGFTKIAVWHERLHHDPAHAWMRDRLAGLV